MRHFFTLEEANALLPVVRTELESLQRIKRELDAKFVALQMLKAGESGNAAESGRDPYFELECEIEFLQLEARTHISNIARTGAELKDIEIGLVDFPALVGGREVLLCWRMGEERIGFYHGREEGFMGRKPLTDEVG